MVQGGDFVNKDGTGMISMYDEKVPDEPTDIRHTGPGLFCMASEGQDTNGCQFFITTAKCGFLDGKNYVFGRLVDGLLTLRKIENVPTGEFNKPKVGSRNTLCGSSLFLTNLEDARSHNRVRGDVKPCAG